METNRFKPDEFQHNDSQTVSLPVASADTTKLTRAPLKGLDAIFRTGPRYKKAGLSS
ncbi:hypothetical protein [Terripilifer ovatus]|uniref:hypothetical protein n=1 Tax=Terripilifer ovatus TaxID=3032367 RepID=UPI003AB98E84